MAYDQQDTYSASISPGFWLKGNTVRLTRNLTTWNQNIRNMVASGAKFQLVTTFNEWGEGDLDRECHGVGERLRLRRLPGRPPQRRRGTEPNARTGAHRDPNGVARQR